MFEKIKRTMGTRIYAYEKSGRIRRLPLIMFESLASGRTRLMEYSDEIVRVLFVNLQLIGREPVAVYSVYGSIWRFDVDGSPAASLQEQIHSVIIFLNSKFKKQDRLLILIRVLERKYFMIRIHGNPLLKI